MIRAAMVVVVLLLAGPAGAQGLADFTGRWQGEGLLTLGDEPGQRFRCQIRLRALRANESFFVGRCATSQAQQSFAYVLTEGADGSLRAAISGETSAEGGVGPGDGGLPAVMLGQAAPGLLRLQGAEGASFELRRDGGALRFTLEGQDRRGPARGEALLQPRD